MRIGLTFAILMVLGYSAIVLLLPAPETSAASAVHASSANILTQQAQALAKP